jgi:hypothetical protein
MLLLGAEQLTCSKVNHLAAILDEDVGMGDEVGVPGRVLERPSGRRDRKARLRPDRGQK